MPALTLFSLERLAATTAGAMRGLAQVSSIEALEAGIRFMLWLSSGRRMFTADVRSFTLKIGYDWARLNAEYEKDESGAVLLWGLKQTLEPRPHLYAWFEAGRQVMFLTNLAEMDNSATHLYTALIKCKSALEGAGISAIETDRIIWLLRGFVSGPHEAQSLAFGIIRECLCNAALKYDRKVAGTVMRNSHSLGLRTQDSGLRTQDSGLRTQDSGLIITSQAA